MNKNSRDDLVGNAIHQESCKRLKFVHLDKRYMQKSKSIKKKKNRTHKIPWDFKIEMDPPTLSRRTVLH